jgi:RNA polymerase sigma factor (sigma-70 family)
MSEATWRDNEQMTMPTAVEPRREAALDADLLTRWRAGADPAAVDQLVRRHSRMVLGICRRMLREPADVDDAFQATFLVFVCKARSLAEPARVAGWLHGVAVRVARKARAIRARRRQRETAMGEPVARDSSHEGDDLRRIIDAELDRLPDRYRLPIILCELDGQTLESAARILECPKGTVAGRLSRGRDLLKRRLSKRRLLGVPFFPFWEGGLCTVRAASPPEQLVSATVAAATGEGPPREQSLALARAVLRARAEWFGRLMIILLVLGLFAAVSWQVRAAVGGTDTKSPAAVGSAATTPPDNAAPAVGGCCHASP